MKGPIPTKLVQKSRYNHLTPPFLGFFFEIYEILATLNHVNMDLKKWRPFAIIGTKLDSQL